MNALSFGERWEDAARVAPSPDPFDLVTHGVSVPAEFLEPFPEKWPAWVPVAYEGALFGGETRWPSSGPGRYYRLPSPVWRFLSAAHSRSRQVELPRVYLGRSLALLASVEDLDALVFLDREKALTHARDALPSVFPE